MREMKDSGIEWIGEIPKEWGIVKFKYLHNGLNTGEAIDKEYWESDAGPNAFYTAGLTPIRTGYSNFPTWKETGENDLLLARNGTPYVYLPVSKAYYTDHIIRAAMSRHVNRRFIRYCLQQSIASIVVDSVSIPTWSATLWNNQLLTWPSAIEQDRIAAFLDAECAEIDAVLEKTRASIEEYKKLKQAVITQAVTKGIRGDRPMKDSGIEWIGDIPAEWEIKRIKNICSLKTGSTPSTGNAEWFNGDLLWFTPGDFNEKFVLLSSNRTLSRTAEKDGVATMIPANSVLVVCIGGSAGKVGYTNYGCSCNQQITALCKSNIMPKLLMYDVNAGMPFLRNTTMFTTLPILNNQAIGGLVLPIPRKEEQLSIIEYLDEKCAGIDALIAKKQQYLTEIENYKKSLIYEYVTGKKEVV